MKRRFLLITAILFTLAIGIVSHAGGWVGSYETGWRYQNDDGSYVTGTWFQDTDGGWYYFGLDSVMQHDAWINGQYYLDSSGRMMTNATTPDGYRVGPDGKWIPDAAPAQTGSQSTGSQAGSASFDDVVQLFQAAFAEGSNEAIQFSNVHGENNDTVVVTANMFNEEDSRVYDGVFVEIAKAAVAESFPEALKAASEAYGRKVHLKVTFMVNGWPYETVTY